MKSEGKDYFVLSVTIHTLPSTQSGEGFNVRKKNEAGIKILEFY